MSYSDIEFCVYLGYLLTDWAVLLVIVLDYLLFCYAWCYMVKSRLLISNALVCSLSI